MKTLYLDGRGSLEVGLDGPALRVRRPLRADGRYPLPRVGRVVVIGRVKWKPNALEACLRFGRPVMILDNQGRFVRIKFEKANQQYGLARHMGELLGVPRFQQRYRAWYLEVERAEMQRAKTLMMLNCLTSSPCKVWAKICHGQSRRWGMRTGPYYRYLLGIASAQVASFFVSVGMPRNPDVWGKEEFRIFSHFLRLERWRLAVLLEELMRAKRTPPTRHELTAAFEALAEERNRRLGDWCRMILLAMAGLQKRGAPSHLKEARLEKSLS
ncbi:MAG TPA: CRISPR-associated endonuclease Cas1 [Acidobacteriota bacterium]|nr:CRISPR-associated endonuclease Cas1 [Acidobacteriota bacterium]